MKSLVSKVILLLFLFLGTGYCLFTEQLSTSKKYNHLEKRATVDVGNTAYGSEFVVSLIQQQSFNQTNGSTLILGVAAESNSDLCFTWSTHNTSQDVVEPSGRATVVIPINDSFGPRGNNSGSYAVRIKTNRSSTVQLLTGSPEPGDSEGTVVYPIDKTGKEFWINTVSNNTQAFAVVASQNDTNIVITFPNGTTIDHMLNEYDVFHHMGSQLLGTNIMSKDNNIAVYAGSNCLPISGNQTNSSTSGNCNYIIESLTSTDQYGTEFIYVNPGFQLHNLSNNTNGTANATNGTANATNGTANATNGTANATNGTANATNGTSSANSGTLGNTNINTSTELLIIASANDTNVTISNRPSFIASTGTVYSIVTNDSTISINSSHPINVQAIDISGPLSNRTQLNITPLDRFFNFGQFTNTRTINATNITMTFVTKTENVQGDTTDLNNNVLINGVIIPHTDFTSVPSYPEYSWTVISLNPSDIYTVYSPNFEIASYVYISDPTNGYLYASPLNFRLK